MNFLRIPVSDFQHFLALHNTLTDRLLFFSYFQISLVKMRIVFRHGYLPSSFLTVFSLQVLLLLLYHCLDLLLILYRNIQSLDIQCMPDNHLLKHLQRLAKILKIACFIDNNLIFITSFWYFKAAYCQWRYFHI